MAPCNHQPVGSRTSDAHPVPKLTTKEVADDILGSRFALPGVGAEPSAAAGSFVDRGSHDTTCVDEDNEVGEHGEHHESQRRGRDELDRREPGFVIEPRL